MCHDKLRYFIFSEDLYSLEKNTLSSRKKSNYLPDLKLASKYCGQCFCMSVITSHHIEETDAGLYLNGIFRVALKAISWA